MEQWLNRMVMLLLVRWIRSSLNLARIGEVPKRSNANASASGCGGARRGGDNWNGGANMAISRRVVNVRNVINPLAPIAFLAVYI
jgi:hypothetical protein